MAVVTGAWLLLSLVAVGFGIALLTGIVYDPEGAGPVAQGLSMIGGAILADLAYYFLVIRRLARR